MCKETKVQFFIDTVLKVWYKVPIKRDNHLVLLGKMHDESIKMGGTAQCLRKWQEL